MLFINKNTFTILLINIEKSICYQLFAFYFKELNKMNDINKKFKHGLTLIINSLIFSIIDKVTAF